MIENLNPLSFIKYGNVIHEGFLSACNRIEYFILSIREYEVKTHTLEELTCLVDSPLVLDIEDGIALLTVALSPTEANDARTFLLDKTVYLEKGVCYGITALYGSCTVKIAYREDAHAGRHPFTGRFTALGYYPEFEITGIHTLFYQDKESNFIFKGEKHDFWELTYVDKGVLYSIVDEKGFRLKQGDVQFYGPGQHHMQWSEADSRVCFITISFDMELDESTFLRGRAFTVDAEMKGLLERILFEKDKGLYYGDDLIICYLKQFIIKLVRNERLETAIDRQETQVKQQIENSIVTRSIEYIKSNIGSKITVGDIAGSIPISQSYLSAIFRKQMDMTLTDYISSFRLEKSKDLIRSSKYNITQISEMLGYASVHYFSSQFKQKYGFSPTEYSKALG